MTKTLFLLFLLVCQHSLADEVLDSINTRLVKKTIAQGQFQQEKYLKILRKPLVSTGTFTYHQNLGVIWKTRTPAPSLLLINEAHLVTSQGEQAVPPAFGGVFKALLGGEFPRLAKNFTISANDDKTTWHIQLTPKDALLKKIISTITLSGDTELRQLQLQETTSNQTTLRFSQISHPDHLSPEQQTDFEHLSP